MTKLQLVDEDGVTIGTADKLSVHEGEGKLHRAVSVLAFDADEKLLIQRRSAGKYHFAGCWANTCCTHVLEGETPEVSAERALWDELGTTANLAEAFQFTYIAPDPMTGLIEYEFDHVLVGHLTSSVSPKMDEVSEVAQVTLDELLSLLESEPESVAPWFRRIIELSLVGGGGSADLARFFGGFSEF